MKRSYQEEKSFIAREDGERFRIDPGFVPNMKVPGYFYANDRLEELTFEELKQQSGGKGGGGFLPAVKQIANVAALPGIVKGSIGLPDVHSGYGFAVGNVAAFDMGDPEAVVSPGGVGFDINCGVRLVRTNLTLEDVLPVKEELTQSLFDHIPVGVGTRGVVPIKAADLNDVLEMGIDWSIREGYAWVEDKEHCEEYGRMLQADPTKVSRRAKIRGLPQLGTLGAGNHYAEIQVVEEIFDPQAAKKMGIDRVNQVCIMIHSGSRGLGHQVATDALVLMEAAMARDKIDINDRQLACAKISSQEGQDYLAGMAAAANYAWVNRSMMTFLTRRAFAKQFGKTAEELDMHLVYDVSHNIAKVEQHVVDGDLKTLLVHRKGATRAFPPHHPLIPVDYQFTGQPVIVGGTMGTCSYVLTGTHKGMAQTFGSTCHGAGRAKSRNESRKTLNYEAVLGGLEKKGISIRVASPKLVMEEAPESYKNVLSFLIACMSMSAASLEDRGVSLPNLLNFLNYAFICLMFFFPMMVRRRGSLNLQLPWFRYAFYSLVDVEANTLSVLAFRYTSITSVAMLDAFSIPAVMFLSCFLLRAQYTQMHVVGVTFCLIGLGLTVISDLQGDEEEAAYPQALKGDVLCVLGAALYAGSNVMQEDFVKNHHRTEFLGMAGVFGVIISGVQTLWLEQHLMAEVEWTPSVVLFTCGYALSLSIMYSWVSLFLQAGDAAMFNLSLLTSDVYAVVFSYVVEKVAPNRLYFAAFAIIFLGLVIYHVQPPPTEASSSADESSGLGFVDADGGGGDSSWAKDSQGMSLRELGREFSGESTDSNTTYGGSGSTYGHSPASLSPSVSETKPWLL
eukprot:g2673.t1